MSDTNQNQNNGQQGGQQQLQVKVPDDLQKGTYSNAVSVNVNSNEVVVDFGYLLPNTPSPIIEVVSRVNMNEKTAESFIKVLSGALEDFKKKQAAHNAAAPAPGVTPAVTPASAPAPMPAPMPHAPMPPQPAAPMPPLPGNA
ncbi:DUF3467 domain-containing protein [Candidatus Peregrinibacteria bacterium]|jgi:hypothetical protein|nr:DUF3467 domain-containing protein [Candidatus Peregrinibacteria bacterium]MBT4631564.1 DUF3467 domain-containing protein [Candidatus Peregrinibacteria bacterium]MBT5517227.1 DUF3467 domain-containing protein [Candidatus Peregrinibacteria bacterium]MBT5823549.1 DUF3467 domain-containing protein [Candidatus Peregrinibacteria bacterium]